MEALIGLIRGQFVNDFSGVGNAILIISPFLRGIRSLKCHFDVSNRHAEYSHMHAEVHVGL